MIAPSGIASVVVAVPLLSPSRRLAVVGRGRPIAALVSGAVATGIAATGGGSWIAASRFKAGDVGCGADAGSPARAAGSDVAAPVEAVSGSTSGCASPDANASTDMARVFASMDGGNPVAGASMLSVVPFGTIAAINFVSSSPKSVGPGCGLVINGASMLSVVPFGTIAAINLVS
jgi:hypothetical protein